MCSDWVLDFASRVVSSSIEYLKNLASGFMMYSITWFVFRGSSLVLMYTGAGFQRHHTCPVSISSHKQYWVRDLHIVTLFEQALMDRWLSLAKIRHRTRWPGTRFAKTRSGNERRRKILGCSRGRFFMGGNGERGLRLFGWRVKLGQ